MRRLVFFIFFLGSLAGAAARDSQYDYVEINTLRQEKDKAQREWQKTTPDLEAHAGTAPKSQVLDEINQARAAASRFSNLEQRYYDSRVRLLSDQVRNLEPSSLSGIDLSRQMIVTMQGMLQNLADDRQSLQNGLDQLGSLKTPLDNDQMVVKEQLNRELQQVQDSYFKLQQEMQNVQNQKHPSPKDLLTTRQALVDTLTLILKDSERQRDVAKQGADLFNSYYGHLRAAVEKRPDEGPPASSSTPTATPGVPNLKPDFQGTWIVPNDGVPQRLGVCNLKAAEMKLEVKGLNIMGSLKLSYDPKADLLDCPPYMKTSSGIYELTLSLKGKVKEQAAQLKFSDPKNGFVGTVEFIPMSAHDAEVNLKENKARVPPISLVTFSRLPEPSGAANPTQ